MKNWLTDHWILIILFLLTVVLSFQILYQIGAWRGDDSIALGWANNVIENNFLKFSDDTSGLYTSYLPSLYLFGFGRTAYRLTQSFLTGLSLVFTYKFAKSFYSKKSAITAAVIMISTPTFVLLFNAEAPGLALFPPVFLFLLDKYRQTKSKEFLYLSFLIIGFAITFKLTFLYFLVSVIFAYLILSDRPWYETGKKYLPTALSFTLLGASPLIVFNLVNNFPTVSFILSNLFETELGHSNVSILESLKQRILQFRHWFGRPTYEMRDLSYDLELIKFQIPAVFIALSCSIISAFYRRNKKTIFLVLIAGIFFLLLSFVPTSPKTQHFVPMLPLLFIVMGRFLKNRPIVTVLLIVLNFAILFQVAFIFSVNSRRTQQFPQLSEAHSELEDSIEGRERVITPFFWHRYIETRNPGTEFRFMPVEQSNYEEKGWEWSVKVHRAEELLKDGLERESTFVLGNPELTGHDEWVYQGFCRAPDHKNLCIRPNEIFHNLVEENNSSIEKRETIHGESDKPVYFVYEVSTT